ncbi:MAG: LysM peptidoglycan-binding domain-containing protein [Treponema sp.]|nr:LysM peptidoglycan-binding domain-containing protein [Treponema sp.]
MIHRLYLAIFIVFIIGTPVSARPMYETETPVPSASAIFTLSDNDIADLQTRSEEEIFSNIRGNRYLLESIRLTRLAEENFNNANFDASYNYAQEAIYYTRLSDAFVAIALAQYRINSITTASNISGQHTGEINEAQVVYDASLSAWDDENWEEAMTLANNAIALLAHIRTHNERILPATYSVRTWALHGDSFWNIAARPWVYGNPHQWRILYNANRSKLPNPNNPNIITPGMVIDIPSIRGETRAGAWDPNVSYPAFE